MQLAKIEVKDLKLQTIIGIHDYERANKQDININFHFVYDATLAIKSDDIANAPCYDSICKFIENYTETNHFGLLESLANSLLKHISQKFTQILLFDLTIVKPNALDNAVVSTNMIWRSPSYDQ